jgi:peptidyl-prolyl cis-trans isomerase B (cyclophilin B)
VQLLAAMKKLFYTLLASVAFVAAFQSPAARAADEVAVIKTSAGEMVAEFWPDVAPKTVENFVTLAKKGFYDGTAFHRIVKGFMVQGGDPKTKDAALEAEWGTGDPGYKIKAEFNAKKHEKGVLSMARSADPDSAGCQFFICLDAAPFLDGKYTTFGKLIKGEDCSREAWRDRGAAFTERRDEQTDEACGRGKHQDRPTFGS